MTNQNLRSNSQVKHPANLSTSQVELKQWHASQETARLLAAIALTGSGWLGMALLTHAGAWAAGQNSSAQDLVPRNLIAQEIMEGLPPPPGGFSVPESRPPSQTVQPSANSAPSASDRRRGEGSRYMVVVHGDSPRLLAQVQRVESNAILQEYQGQRFIQVATFDSSDYAERQVQILASRGIGAKIVSMQDGTPVLPPNRSSAQARSAQVQSSQAQSSQAQSSQTQSVPQQFPSQSLAAAPDLPPPDLLPTQPVPREIEFGRQNSSLNQFPSPPELPSNSNPTNSGDGSRNLRPQAVQPEAIQPEQTLPPEQVGRAYYVVIPGKQNELDAISNQVMRLGDGLGIAQLVQQGNSRGPHVQIGPFTDRHAANRWSRYFRSFGMDARVFVD